MICLCWLRLKRQSKQMILTIQLLVLGIESKLQEFCEVVIAY